MKFNAAHVLSLLAILLPSLAIAIQQNSGGYPKLALAGAILGSLGLALARSVVPDVNTKAAIEQTALTTAAVVAKDVTK